MQEIKKRKKGYQTKINEKLDILHDTITAAIAYAQKNGEGSISACTKDEEIIETIQYRLKQSEIKYKTQELSDKILFIMKFTKDNYIDEIVEQMDNTTDDELAKIMYQLLT